MPATKPPELDWDALEEELINLLSDYIRIDTSNPPGNESLAAHWFGALLEGEGIACEYFEPEPGRESLIARLPGSAGTGPDGALVLLNHTDVVPVEEEHWTEPAFAGIVKDGFLWGRGALDMKSLGILEYLSFVLVKRLNLPHRRDLVFFAVADEEAGSEVGVEWFAKHHPEQLRGWAVINEGGGGTSGFMGSDRPVFGVGASEKTPLWLRLRTQGAPGHGSVPRPDNAMDRMVRALSKILDWQRERTVTPEVQEYFDAISAAGLVDPVRSTADAEKAAQKSAVFSALTEDTISLTTINAGIKVNVIPATCEATLDCRLLPGSNPDEFEAELRRRVDDPQVTVERIFSGFGPSSSMDHPLVETIRQVVREHVEDALVVPSVGTGFTDSRTYRRQGVPAFGFSGILAGEKERRTVHGHDERVPLDSLRLALQILFEVVRRSVE